jgi:hypothetical protein
VKGVKYGLVPANIVNTVAPIESWGNPSKKELFDWFEDWVKLVNMKNKELKTFLDSDWGAVAGLSPQEAKDWNNIKSGRVSGRRILKMRKKLGLTGPKDYIDPNKPRILEDYYEKALNNWTGPSDDMQKGETDWDWCKRQVRFNKRFMGDVFGERKGPLVRKQKTQNQPSRRLLSLWVWGHDPWRYARKVEKRERMPKCPNVPWIGMTEKRKWGVIEVIPGPKKNPMVRVKKDEYRSYFMDEEGNDLTSIPFESVSFTAGQNVANFGEPMTRKEALTERDGTWWRVNVSAYKGREPIIEVAPIKHFTSPAGYNNFMTVGRKFYKNFFMEGPVFPTMLTHMAQEPSAILIVQGELQSFGQEELRSDITDWKGVSKGGGRLPVYESGEITAVDSEQVMFTFTPDKNELRVEAHIINHTKNVSEQVYVVRVEDKGDHYWLHEIQVSPKHRGQSWLRWGLERMLFNLVDRIPDYPNKRPVRTLARVVEGIPQKELVRVLEETGFEKIEEVDGGVLMEFDYQHFEEVFGNPRTEKGRKFPSKYLKGLTATEKAIAKYEIDKGYEYSMDDPEAYKFWKSDIKAKARGMKILPSKWRNKFARKYGPLKDGYDFLDRMSKTTGVKRKYLKKIQDKGLAAWRVGHRPGVTQMQWARGRVYAFVMAAPSSTGPGKPDHKLAVEAGVR